MLRWKKSKSKGKLVFDSSLSEVAEQAIRAALVELWSKLLDEVEAAYPAGGWEIFVAYITLETGDLLVYPTTAANPSDGRENVHVSLHVDSWHKAYDECSGLPESKFEAGYNRQLKAAAKALAKAIDEPDVAPRFKALKTRPPFAVYYVDAVEVAHLANLTFLWGNKPAKTIPSGSAAELFEFLLRKAQAAPKYSMTFKGKTLRTVTFFGADFNDKYVDLIAGVPNVGDLCKGLRQLRLSRTRIKPAAIERLRQLLPEVDVRIVEDDDDDDEE